MSEQDYTMNKGLKCLGKLVGRHITVFFANEKSESGILHAYNYLYHFPFIVLKDENDLYKLITMQNVCMIQERFEEQL